LSGPEPQALACACARCLDERKAEDILLLRVEELTSIADYFLIATGRNVRHLRALSRQVQEAAGEFGATLLGLEGTAESGWILVDLGDAVIHLFDPPRRDLYSLEVLWGDAPEEDWQCHSSRQQARD
jgi:ribosome-associated protein